MTDRYLFRGFHPCENGSESVWIDGKEIKGKWVYGFYVDRNGMSHIYVEIVDEFSQCGSWYTFVKVIPKTVGQYTGVLGTDDNKIFENDIVERCYDSRGGHSIERGIITFEKGCFITEGLLTKDYEDHNELPIIVSELECGEFATFKALGSIHSNPDILERKEN